MKVKQVAATWRFSELEANATPILRPIPYPTAMRLRRKLRCCAGSRGITVELLKRRWSSIVNPAKEWLTQSSRLQDARAREQIDV